MSFVINSKEMLEEWLDAMFATPDFPHTDALVRDYYFRPWIVIQSDDHDEYQAYGIPLPEEDWSDANGVPLTKLSYPVRVYT